MVDDAGRIPHTKRIWTRNCDERSVLIPPARANFTKIAVIAPQTNMSERWTGGPVYIWVVILSALSGNYNELLLRSLSSLSLEEFKIIILFPVNPNIRNKIIMNHLEINWRFYSFGKRSAKGSLTANPCF